MRRHLLVLLKAAVSLFLLYLALRSVRLDAVAERLSRLEVVWLLAALAILAGQVVIQAFRWREIAAACGIRSDFGPMAQMSFIGMFFNQVLPSTVGGDAARIWLLARRSNGWAGATYSVLLDRIAGVLMLALIVIACLPWSLALITDALAQTVLFMMGAAAVGGAVIFMMIGKLPRHWLDGFLPTRHLGETSRAAWRLVQSPRSMVIIVLCSLSIHLMTVAVAWCCMRAVDAPVGFAPILFLMPPVLLVATIPISIAGWGVRESSMVVAFSYAGLSQIDGLTLSILFGAMSFAIGAVGGLVWVASGLKVNALSQAVANKP